MKFIRSSKLGITLGLVLATSSSYATDILFAHVDNDGSYVGNGNLLASIVDALPGVTVTTRFLDAAVYNDYASFDQVWVYDLYTGADNEANQLANYANIGAWYNGLTDQNLIVDGRIISSTPGWSNPPEEAWIQNYATQLDLRGGGLVLGTDHATAFTQGINEINAAIGLNPFADFIYEFPYEALVDPNSPLFLSSLPNCSSSVGDKCIDDSSSTSIAPTGLQPNGQVLTPVAFHGSVGGAWDNAAVASTIGSITFDTCDDGSQPPCDVPPTGVPAPGSIALIALGLAGIGYRRRKQIRAA